jgi:hypothetical protein
MAYRLEKEKTGSTPYLLIDEERNYMKLEGRSFHENIVDFFKDANEWLDRYLATDFGTFTFDCEMNYFNSSTAKLLLNIIMKLDKNTGDGKEVVINWITTESNDIVIECGEDFQDEVENLTFNLVVS